jgi:hypothetical protein
VPVLKPAGNVPITGIKIDGQRWIRNHVRSIRSAYGKAPFFEHYAGEVFRAIEDSGEMLFETNRSLLQTCLQLVGMDKSIRVTDAYREGPAEHCADMRDIFDAGKAIRGGVTIEYDRYHQVFGGPFERNMSIVDLLFCEGPNAKDIIGSGRVRLNDPKE